MVINRYYLDIIRAMRISRPVVYALILITVLFLSFTIPGDKGLIRSYQLYQELKHLKAQNASLKVKTNRCPGSAHVKENLAYIEHVTFRK